MAQNAYFFDFADTLSLKLIEYYCYYFSGERLMQKIETKEIILRKDERFDGGDSYTYLLSTRESDFVASFGITLYSVRVELVRSNGVSSFAEIKDVFASYDKANRFVDKLARNLATPIDLPYVLEDEMEIT